MPKHSLKRLLADLNWCFYSGVGAVLLFSSLSISTLDHFIIELFRNFPLQYFVIGLISFIWSIVSRNVRGIILSVVVVGLNYSQIMDYPLTFFRCCEGASADGFRAMSVNVLTSNLRKGELFERVKKHSPDVISFLEVNSEWLLEIESRIGVEYPHHVEVLRPDNFGIALRSKFPIVKAKIDALGERQPETIVAELLIMDKTVRVISTHPVPPMSSSNNSLNNQQLKSITDLVSENKIPTIVMGDLNSTPWGLGFKSLINRTKLKDPRRDFGIIPTWPADKSFKKIFSIPIDHILVSEDFKVLNLQVDPAPGSDHRMIIADLK